MLESQRRPLALRLNTTKLNELASLLTLLREHNVLTYKTPELELFLGPIASEFKDETLTQREEREQAEEDDVTFAHVAV